MLNSNQGILQKNMDKKSSGWINGLIGVVIFAGSLPATRIAVMDLDPLFLTGARATIAALIGLTLLVFFRQPRPALSDIPSLGIVAFGVVVGFPLFTALALQHISSAHSTIFLGLLPLCTAIFGVLRGGESPRPIFWLFSILGSSFVISYAALGEIKASLEGNLFMLAAIVVCGLGYAEGAKLSRRLGGWQVISWALAAMLPIAWLTSPASMDAVGASAWAGLAYVSLFSMFIGSVFWYRGLAQGGIAAVGQLQLLQPFLALGVASTILHETVSWGMMGVTLGAVSCVAGARKFAN